MRSVPIPRTLFERVLNGRTYKALAEQLGLSKSGVERIHRLERGNQRTLAKFEAASGTALVPAQPVKPAHMIRLPEMAEFTLLVPSDDAAVTRALLASCGYRFSERRR